MSVVVDMKSNALPFWSLAEYAPITLLALPGNALDE
jgi:hypothetical protein